MRHAHHSVRLLACAGPLAVTAALAAPAPALALTNDVSSRSLACADITKGSGIYPNEPDTSTLLFRATFAAAPFANDPSAASPCRKVTYTLNVYDASGAPLPSPATITSGPDPTDPTRTIYTVTGLPASGVVCVQLVTSIGGHTIDAAPDSGCEVVDLAASGSGGTHFN